MFLYLEYEVLVKCLIQRRLLKQRANQHPIQQGQRPPSGPSWTVCPVTLCTSTVVTTEVHGRPGTCGGCPVNVLKAGRLPAVVQERIYETENDNAPTEKEALLTSLLPMAARLSSGHSYTILSSFTINTILFSFKCTLRQ